LFLKSVLLLPYLEARLLVSDSLTHSLILKKEIADIGGLWDIRELSPVKLVVVLWHLWLIQSDQNGRDSLVAFVVAYNCVILP
jgi:hypothetical protein